MAILSHMKDTTVSFCTAPKALMPTIIVVGRARQTMSFMNVKWAEKIDVAAAAEICAAPSLPGIHFFSAQKFYLYVDKYIK